MTSRGWSECIVCVMGDVTSFLCYLPPNSLFGVLDAPSPISNSAGLVGGGVCTREPDGFRDDIGADIDGRRLTKLSGRPSSESLSPDAPV